MMTLLYYHFDIYVWPFTVRNAHVYRKRNRVFIQINNLLKCLQFGLPLDTSPFSTSQNPSPFPYCTSPPNTPPYSRAPLAPSASPQYRLGSAHHNLLVSILSPILSVQLYIHTHTKTHSMTLQLKAPSHKIPLFSIHIISTSKCDNN